MVVDDDVRLRDLLRRYLTEQGFNVFTAESATAMNKLWLRERYDLLVLDLMLPGEDGLSICRRLRGAGDQTPIIMLTAKGEDVDRIVGLEMGADDYLPKPFFFSVRVPRSSTNWPNSNDCGVSDGAPGISSGPRRRSTAPMRATSSRGLNGLGR